ncbi:bactericidal permeability-increasing protein-like [Neosynchiropus ocellatus]
MKMFLCCWLVLVALTHSTSSTIPGAQLKLTEKGLEYGNGCMQIVNVALPQSSVNLVPNVGVRLNIPGAFISMRGNWWVRYLRVFKARGSLTLNIYALNIQSSLAITKDAEGRPAVNAVNCVASVGSVGIKFYGGASWLYNLFRKFLERPIRSALEARICPLLGKAVSDLNPLLKKMNVIAKVDQFAEIDYSMVSAPVISSSAINFNLKGQFYNTGNRQEPPFPPDAFSLPPERDHMLYFGISAFTSNSAGFVYNRAGGLSINITTDRIREDLVVPLNTTSFEHIFPEVYSRYPNLDVQLLVENVKSPDIIYNTNLALVQTTATMTAYAVHSNESLSPLFILNMDARARLNMSIREMKLFPNLILDKLTLSLNKSYVGDLNSTQVDSFEYILVPQLQLGAIQTVNKKGYPLPALAKVKLYNTQLRVMKDYVLIGTDVIFEDPRLSNDVGE